MPEDGHAYPNRHPTNAAKHADAYEQGREALQQDLLALDPGAPFVAKAFAMGRADGGAHTQTTWTQGVPTLLPAVDVICLIEDPPTPGSDPVLSFLRWDVVAEACADDCWELREDLTPPRLFTKAWPTPPTLDRLRNLKLR